MPQEPADIPTEIYQEDPAPPSPSQDPPILAFFKSKVLPFSRAVGFRIYDNPGDVNIFFVAGHNEDGSPNDDAVDRWNDICIVARATESGWEIPFVARATWTPGSTPTKAGRVEKRGGVACIYPGQYKAWKPGFHKKATYGDKHPALVQVAPVTYTRDANKDFSRVGDKAYNGVIGINIHSTIEGFERESLGNWSEGCAVVMNFLRFQREFMPIINEVASKYPIFTAAFITREQICK